MKSFSMQILGGLLAAQKAGIDWTFDYRNLAETTYTDEAGTILALPGDVVAYIEDQSGNGNHAIQPTLAERMELAITPPRLLLGAMTADPRRALVTVPTGGWQGHMTIANQFGVATYRVNIPAGSYRIGRNGSGFGCGSGVAGSPLIGQSFANRLLSPAEIAAVESQFVALGAGDYGLSTSFNHHWAYWPELAEMPTVNTSNGSNFGAAFSYATGLLSYPILDYSNGTSFIQTWRALSLPTEFPPVDLKKGETFNLAWLNCTNLADFPPNMFDGCLAANFDSAFNGTNLTVDSINGILVSINSNGTSNGTFGQSGGSAPTLAGQQAIDAMRARGWTITVTGGY